VAVRRQLGASEFPVAGSRRTDAGDASMSGIRQMLPETRFDEVFSWVCGLLDEKDPFNGKTLGIDATILETSAAMRSIVRKDTGAGWKENLRTLTKVEGMESPADADLQRHPRPALRPGRVPRVGDVGGHFECCATRPSTVAQHGRDGGRRGTFQAVVHVDKRGPRLAPRHTLLDQRRTRFACLSVRFPHLIVRFEQLHGLLVFPPRFEQELGSGEIRRSALWHCHLLRDRRHGIPRIEDVRYPGPGERGKVVRLQPLLVPQLHPVTPATGKLPKKGVQVGHEPATVRVVAGIEPRKLEHEHAQLLLHRFAGPQETAQKQIGIEEVRVGLSRAVTETRQVGKPPDGDLVGDFERKAEVIRHLRRHALQVGRGRETVIRAIHAHRLERLRVFREAITVEPRLGELAAPEVTLFVVDLPAPPRILP